MSRRDQPLEQYGFQGPGATVQRTLPLDPIVTPSSTTTGQITVDVTPDRFGRAGEVSWSSTITNTPYADPATAVTTVTSLDDFKYGLDADSNPTYSQNLTPGGSAFSEQYTYDSLERQNNYYRGMLSGTTISSPTLSQRWQLDAQGNRYAPADGSPSPYPTSYNQDNQSNSGSYNSDGTASSLPFATTTNSSGLVGSGQESAGAKYDAWGELTQITGADSSPSITFRDDALGRVITEGTPGAQTDLYYNGTNVVEERQGSVLTAQYVWAPDGTLVLRDRYVAMTNGGNASPLIPNPTGTKLNERLYALTDAFGSVTAIAAVDGTVVERYVYDANGRPQPLSASWGAYAGATSSSGPDQYTSLYDWQYLYHGARWVQLFTNWSQSYSSG